LANHFGAGITAAIPAFDPADLGSPETAAVMIQQIVSKLQEKYAPYDIFFTTDRALKRRLHDDPDRW
jgi:hypothetical protein